MKSRYFLNLSSIYRILRLILEILNYKSAFFKLLKPKKFIKFWGLFLSTIIILGSFYPFNSAEAGIFSFFEKMFVNSGTQEAMVVNSQTMPLLSAPLNEDPAAGKGGGNITIVNDNALLPDVGPLGSIADVEDQKNQNDQISIYMVREGDSLSQIAKMFGVSVNTIIWANNIKRGDLIKTGQTLIILPISGINYTVKDGDTLAGIAEKFKGDADEIIQFNNLPLDGGLAVGTEIIIPNGETALPVYSSGYVQREVGGAGGPLYSGYYLRPISNGRKSQGLHGYNAVDLAAPCGEPILAAASGDVMIARSYGWNGGYGKYIVISHSNATQTLYAHNSENIVSTGWHVVQGQVIGYIGATGNSTGCHVHFEVRGAANPF